MEYLTKIEGGKTKTETTKYLHGPGIDEPLAIERKGETYSYHADGLGSITALSDSRQKAMESYSYSSFGDLKRQGDKVKNTYAFTGREWDEEIGLYYYRARYYDAEVGRFISEDPINLSTIQLPLNIRQIGAPPISLDDLVSLPKRNHPYNYVENNPINLVDPNGEVSCSYSITGRVLTCTTSKNETISCYALSGNNNPSEQCIKNIGPIPTGNWSIGNPGSGIRAPLTPQAGTNTCGRSGFQIHGWGITEGCIAVKLNTCRDKVMEALRCENGGTLKVLP